MNAREYKHTQQVALETLYGGDTEPGLINELILLTQDTATTQQLEESVKKADLILRTLRTWVSSRHLIECAPRRCPVVTRAEIDGALGRVASL